MRKSSAEEIALAHGLVLSIHERIKQLIEGGKKVHVIWDFDGVLSDSSSDDVFMLTEHNLDAYFTYEERLLLESPERGLWYLPIAHNARQTPRFPSEHFSQDVVTARSSAPALRAQIFCLNMPVRWMLFVGHQSKEGAYRIILESFKKRAEYHIFCIDDGEKHINTFERVVAEMGMKDRCTAVLSPVVRQYTKEELQERYNRITKAVGDNPVRVRDPANETRGYIVLPNGFEGYRKRMTSMICNASSEGHQTELRNAFIKVFGPVGSGHFKTEEELTTAMNEFIVGLHCP